jgi:hypothetical protein
LFLVLERIGVKEFMLDNAYVWKNAALAAKATSAVPEQHDRQDITALMLSSQYNLSAGAMLRSGVCRVLSVRHD